MTRRKINPWGKRNFLFWIRIIIYLLSGSVCREKMKTNISHEVCFKITRYFFYPIHDL